MNSGNVRFARNNGTWFLRLGGDLRHTLGPALNTLLDTAFRASDTSGFLLDLSGAEAIDSTCLGVLARIADWSKQKGASRPIIVTDNEDIIETLYALCFDRLFELQSDTATTADDWSDLSESDASADQVGRLILEAHRRLCAIDADNHAVFRDLVETLEQELDPQDERVNPD